MQLSQLLQPLQSGSFRFARTFLNDNPDLLQKYINTGMNVVGIALVPLNSFMKHLLVIQKIDPNTVPGQKAQRQLEEAMNVAFESDHAKEYDEDFNFGWINKRFEETRKQLKALQLTKERFVELTDLARLPGGFPRVVDSDEAFLNQTTEVNRVAPVSEKKELPLDTREGRDARRKKVLEEAERRLTGIAKKVAKEMVSFDPITDLRNAVKAIEEEVLEKKEPKKGIKTSKKKANKRIVPVSKRTLSGRTELADRLVRKMIANGLMSDTPEAMAAQMTEIAKWDDAAFEATTRVLEKHFPKKDPENKFKGSFRRVNAKGQ